MRILFLDFECTDTLVRKKKRDPSPYLSSNFLVSYGYRLGDEVGYYFLSHKDFKGSQGDNRDKLQELLDRTDLLVAFNCKFELSWLMETGFKYSGKLYDPMVVEYILARGTSVALDLDSCCKRRGAIGKLGDLVSEFWDAGLNFYQMPIEIVEEYGRGDIDSLESLFSKQLDLLKLPENSGLIPTIEMSNEFIWCLVDMERSGICIDLEALNTVEEQFSKEHTQLKKDLEAIVEEVMGDTKINLDSPEQLSWLIYSRKVKDKHVWKELFNIGTDARGKRNRVPRFSPSAFMDAVRTNTEVLRRTTYARCVACKSSSDRPIGLESSDSAGKSVRKTSKCKYCSGNGYILVSGTTTAGLKLSPTSASDVSAGGFATDKETINRLIISARSSGKGHKRGQEFLEKLVRYGAIGTYLDTFVGGIRRGVASNGILHYKLMQCITRTGRLSSQEPNFQNMPRARTFPIRLAVVSRFPDGVIVEVDFAQLEFRVAAFLSQDEQAIKDILEGIDVHSYTSKVLTDAGQPTNRQDAKPHTFKPLYGGSSGTPAEQAYYEAFKKKYPKIAEWQKQNIAIALKGKPVIIPSGREYSFPGTRRTPSGYVVNTTQICNYPVQGFATADIVPCALIDLRRYFNEHSLNSLINLTVHDSIVIDCAPTEISAVHSGINAVFDYLRDSLRRRYGVDINLPLDWETKMGKNWYAMETVK